MKENDEIKELFKSRLENHQTPVKPELWNAVSSQIGSAAATSSAVAIKSIIIKSLIGVSVASIAIVSYIYITSPEDSIKETKQIPTLIKEQTNQNKEEVLLSEEIKEKDGSMIKNEVFDEKNNTSKQELKTNTPYPPIVDGEIDDSEFESRKTPQSSLSNNTDKQIETANKAERINQVELIEEEIVTGGVPEIQQESTEETSASPEIIDAEELVAEKDVKDQEARVILPNIFTPNGDGLNDYLLIELDNLSEFSVVVLDMNSKVVYKSENINFKWDGSLMNGDPAPSGNYVYYITAKNINGKLIQKHSTLRINR